ncbi:MAG: hypothetical protein IJ721_00495 [Bacteroidales bacterium]|nr:hypothetical protein [Bacteroidales bacterium]
MQKIAQVLKSNGRDGGLLVSFIGIAPEDIDLQEPVSILWDGLPVPYFFESFSPRGNHRALVHLTGVRSLEDADELAGSAIYADDDGNGEEDDDFTGWTVLEQDGRKVGTVTGYEDIPGNLCLEVDTENGQVLLPLHEDLVLSADETSGTLTLRIPDGLLEL